MQSLSKSRGGSKVTKPIFSNSRKRYYCNRVLVINHLMSYVDVYMEAFVISIKNGISCIGKANQLTGNSEGERRYKMSLCKVCFLARKDKHCDRQPSSFGPFYRPKWRISLPFHILHYQLGKSLPFLYLKPKKSYPFRAEPSHIGHYVELKRAISDLRNEHTYLMHAHTILYTDVSPWLFKKLNEFILI